MSAADKAGPGGLQCNMCGRRHASVGRVAECDVGEPICDFGPGERKAAWEGCDVMSPAETGDTGSAPRPMFD